MKLALGWKRISLCTIHIYYCHAMETTLYCFMLATKLFFVIFLFVLVWLESIEITDHQFGGCIIIIYYGEKIFLYGCHLTGSPRTTQSLSMGLYKKKKNHCPWNVGAAFLEHVEQRATFYKHIDDQHHILYISIISYTVTFRKY